MWEPSQATLDIGLVRPLWWKGYRPRVRPLGGSPKVPSVFKKRSRIAPLSMTEYRPREANFVSDYLAGQGSQKLLSMVAKNQCLPTTPVWVDIDPPYESYIGGI